MRHMLSKSLEPLVVSSYWKLNMVQQVIRTCANMSGFTVNKNKQFTQVQNAGKSIYDVFIVILGQLR